MKAYHPRHFRHKITTTMFERSHPLNKFWHTRHTEHPPLHQFEISQICHNRWCLGGRFFVENKVTLCKSVHQRISKWVDAPDAGQRGRPESYAHHAPLQSLSCDYGGTSPCTWPLTNSGTGPNLPPISDDICTYARFYFSPFFFFLNLITPPTVR